MRAAYNMAESVVWLHEQFTRVPVCVWKAGARMLSAGVTVLSPGGTVLSAECGIGGERLGVDYAVRLNGLTTASLLSDAAIASSGVAFSSLGHCCSV